MTPADAINRPKNASGSRGYMHDYRQGIKLLVPCDDRAMNLNDNIRKCVAYAAAIRKGEHAILGTVFFHIQRLEGTDRYCIYVVTARHIVERAAELSSDAKIYLRLNGKSDDVCWIAIPFGDWEFHADDKIDVAVVSPDELNHREMFMEKLSHGAVNSDMYLTDKTIGALRLTAGEDLFFPGLFVKHPGGQSNIPIIRTGSLAALAGEKIQTSRGLARVHLAEMRSIGGHSGSPVFVHFDDMPDRIDLNALNSGAELGDLARSYPLLGMVHGFFPIGRDQFVCNLPYVPGGSSSETAHPSEDFNSGIAAVVPGTDILDVLAQPRCVEFRKERAEEIITAGSGPTVET